MKKKIYAFLLVLASIVACIVCLAACNNGDGAQDANRGEYVGNYEFVSMHMVTKIEGVEDIDVDIVAGEDGVTTEYVQLELNDNGNFVYQIQVGMDGSYMTLTGSWTVKGGKLELTYKDGSGSKTNADLTDGVLTMYSSTGSGNNSVQQVIKLKKIVEQNSAE